MPRTEQSSLNFGLIALGFGIAVAYVPGWSGASISTTWFLLMFVIPILLFFYNIPVKNAHLLGALFVGYTVISICWSIRFNTAFFILIQLIVLSLVFCFGSTLVELKNIFRGMALGLGVSDIFAILQKLNIGTSYTGIYSFNDGHNIAGLFVNENVFCELSVIMFISLLVFRLYWWLPLTLPGIVFVHSRAALVALLVGLICLTKQKWLLLVGLVIGLVLYKFSYFNLDSISERISIWKDTIRGLTFWGNGVGSFELTFPLNAKDIDTAGAQGRPRYAHNEYLHFLFEFGIGALLLVPFIKSILKIKCDEKVILYVAGVIAFFSFPMHIPMSAFIICLVAGFITRYDATPELLGSDSRSLVLKRRAF